jgi:hypothetical protein
MKTFASIGLGLLLVFTMAVFVVGCGAPADNKGDDVSEPAEVTPSDAAVETMEEPAAAMEETTPDSAAPADATEEMTEEPAAQEEATETGEETAADSGEALTDEFDDFDYSVGGGAASKRR